MTASALEPIGPAPAEGSESQERLIAAAVRQSVGDVPVILCGSRATGTGGPSSDFDVLAVLPWRRVPRSIRTLGALSARLSGELGVPVSVNPLPARRLRRHVNLFLWKVAHEGRVLWSPPGFALPRAGRPPSGEKVRFSCLMSALHTLLLGADATPHAREDAADKALSMLAQTRLLTPGRRAATLAHADAELRRVGDDPRELRAAPDGWSRICSRVLTEISTLSGPGAATAALVNLRYAALALLHGRRRFRVALSPRPVDRRLADVAVELARAIESSEPDPARVDSARRLLPRSLRPPAGSSWTAVRDVVLQEWPDAHPLLGQ